MVNVHTCSTSSVDLFVAVVPVADHQSVEFAGDVVGGIGVDLPGCVDTVQGCSHPKTSLMEVGVEPFPTLVEGVTHLAK